MGLDCRVNFDISGVLNIVFKVKNASIRCAALRVETYGKIAFGGEILSFVAVRNAGKLQDLIEKQLGKLKFKWQVVLVSTRAI